MGVHSHGIVERRKGILLAVFAVPVRNFGMQWASKRVRGFCFCLLVLLLVLLLAELLPRR